MQERSFSVACMAVLNEWIVAKGIGFCLFTYTQGSVLAFRSHLYLTNKQTNRRENHTCHRWAHSERSIDMGLRPTEERGDSRLFSQLTLVACVKWNLKYCLTLSLGVRVLADTFKGSDWGEFNEGTFYKNVSKVKGNQQGMVLPHGWQSQEGVVTRIPRESCGWNVRLPFRSSHLLYRKSTATVKCAFLLYSPNIITCASQRRMFWSQGQVDSSVFSTNYWKALRILDCIFGLWLSCIAFCFSSISDCF